MVSSGLAFDWELSASLWGVDSSTCATNLVCFRSGLVTSCQWSGNLLGLVWFMCGRGLPYACERSGVNLGVVLF